MKILVAGDYYPASKLKQQIDLRDYSFLEEINSYTKRVDYSIVNFESPVVLGKYEPIKKCGPNLQSSKYAIEAISYAGFNLLTLANNHILDYGESGLNDTLKTCSEYQIDSVGVGSNLKEASQIFYKQIGNEKLAIINCCEHEFSIATEKTAGANPLNSIRQYYQIREAKEKADYVLVIVHGGHEYFQLPSLRMIETYRFFIDAGADAIVNHHQHCYSGYEIHKKKPIFYGIGNFCFAREREINSIWNEGFLLELNFMEDNISFNLYPYLQCNGDTKINFSIDRVKWEKNIMKLNMIITNHELLKEECHKFYQQKKDSMLMLFEPYSNRIFNKLYRMNLLPTFFDNKKKLRIENMVNCEAHRDIFIYNLHQK